MENKNKAYSSRQLITVAEVATALAHGKDIAGLEAVQALAEAAQVGDLCINLYPPHEKWQNDGNAARIGLPSSNSHQIWKSLAVKSNQRHTSTKADFDYPPAASTYHLLAEDVFAYATCQKLTKQAAMALRDLAVRYKIEFATPETRPQAEASETAPVVQAPASEPRRRYQMCIDAGLVMPDNDYAKLPVGINLLAEKEGITKQAFSKSVKKHLATLSK